jgi:serine/threonine protein kinase
MFQEPKGANKLKRMNSARIRVDNVTDFPGSLNITSINDYKMGKLLGQGAYALVREADHLGTGFKVAVKIYDKYKLIQNSNIVKTV